jgi:hypothetical protein
MNSFYDYDVFLSFASKDTEVAKEVWQTLSLSGLRVFWSSDTLRNTVGQSFVSKIQESLIESQNFLLYWSENAENSAWVEEEYQTFYSQCYMKDKASRRLIILLKKEKELTSLPPFLKNLQISRSIEEIIPILGGVDIRKIKQENQELQRQLNLFRNENQELKKKIHDIETSPISNQLRKEDDEINKLRAKLHQYENQIASLKLQLEQSSVQKVESSTPAKPNDHAYGLDNLRPSLDEQQRAAILKAVKEIEVETGAGMGGGWIKEKNVFPTWKALYASYKEQVILELCAILEDQEHEWKDYWKAITLLDHGSRTPEGRRLIERIFDSTCYHVLNKGHVGTAALKLIAEAPASPQMKWKYLFSTLESASPDSAGQILRHLPQFTPKQERERTCEVISDILLYSTDSSTISYTISALKSLNCSKIIPKIREMLVDSPLSKANQVAELLAYFGDKNSIPAIRDAIENWGYGPESIHGLVVSLQTLAGPDCAGYIAKILLEALPRVQIGMLSSSLFKNQDIEVLEAAKQLALSADDIEVKKSAENYVASRSK